MRVLVTSLHAALTSLEIKLSTKNEILTFCEKLTTGLSMPPKTRKSTSKTATTPCGLCCNALKDGEDILCCSGPCKSQVHRYCAAVTVSHFHSLQTNSASSVPKLPLRQPLSAFSLRLTSSGLSGQAQRSTRGQS